MPTYTIYSITMSNGSYKYIGMTTQNLQKRFAQHKADARSGSCSLSTKLCQRRKPTDLNVLHTKLKKNPNGFRMHGKTKKPKLVSRGCGWRALGRRVTQMVGWSESRNGFTSRTCQIKIGIDRCFSDCV